MERTPRWRGLTRARRWRGALLVVAAVGLAACQVPPPPPGPPPADPPGPSSIVFDGSPGTSAPPATLGPFTMTSFAADARPVPGDVTDVAGPTGSLGFGAPVSHVRIGSGWSTWSHSFAGDVYFTKGARSLTLTLPPNTGAFAFYVEPNNFSTFNVTASSQDDTTSGAVPVEGFAGATYFGFYGVGDATIASITITSTISFAVGEFGIAEAAGDELQTLQDVHAWFSRRNIFDRVPLDLRAELLQNGNPVASAVTRCIDWHGISPFVPREVVLGWEPFAPVPVASGDVFTLRISARFGTTPEDEPCEPETVKVGKHVLPRLEALRLFYDGAFTPSRFGIGIGDDPASDRFLRSDGSPCGIHDSFQVTTRTLEPDPPVDTFSKCQDSPVVGKDPANGWQEIGVWAMAPLA